MTIKAVKYTILSYRKTRKDTFLYFESNKVNESHYKRTPYFFKETHAKRIALDHYVDLGEGLLNYIYELKKEKGDI